MKNWPYRSILTILFLSAVPTSNAADMTQAPPSALSDKALTFKVKTIYVNDPVLYSLGATIQVRDGVAYLSGEAPDEQIKQRLEKMPLQVEGIKGVKSSVTVHRIFIEKQ